MPDFYGYDDPEAVEEEDPRRRLFGLPRIPITTPPFLPPAEPEPGTSPNIRFPTSQLPASLNTPAAKPSPLKWSATERLANLQEPKLGGWKRALDIAGQVLAPGIEPLIPGTQGNYQLRRAGLERQADREMQGELQQAALGERQAQTRNIESEIRKREQPPQPGKSETVDRDVYDALIAQGKSPQEALEIIKSAGKQDKPGSSDAAYAVTKMMHPELKEGTPEFAKAWEDLRMKERTDPGLAKMGELLNRGYTPVNDAAGRVVGWANPITGQFRSVGSIPGASEAAAGQAGAPIPAKPSGQTLSRMQQGEAIQRAGDNLIADLKARANKVGNWGNYWKQLKAGTPMADPDQAYLGNQLMSFAALQPAAHGARGLQAIQAFEKVVGGTPRSLDALIAGIQGIQRGLGSLQPPTGQQPGGATPTSQPLTNFHVNPKTGERIGWDGTKWVPAPAQ